MLKLCTGQIQELVLTSLNSQIAVKLIGSVAILKDSYTGVLTRCLESLERYDKDHEEHIRTSLALREVRLTIRPQEVLRNGVHLPLERI